MLLILTSDKDLTADFLIVELINRSLPYFRLNAEELTTADFTFSVAEDQIRRALALGPRSVNLDDITAVWFAACYSAQQADKNAFDKMLINTHPKVREKLREAFHDFAGFLHLGPHEPSPTQEVPVPISRHDARFALVTAHAIFEYFASESWPGI